MNIRNKLAGGAALLLVTAGLTIAPAAVSIAHTPTASASCSGVKVDAKDYEANKLNTVEVIVGEVVTTETFGKSYSKTFPVPQDSATTSWSVKIAAEDGGYALVKTGVVGPCGVKNIVAPNLGVAPPTCSEDGYLSPDFTQGTPAQNPNGWEGDGWRVYLDQPFVGVGTYNYNIQKQGPGFNPAYPNGTKVTGTLSGTLVVLPAIGFQTADPDAPCYNRPDVPEPTVVVTYGEWKDGDKSCESKVVNTSREKYKATMTQAWDEELKKYVDTEPVVETTVEHSTRPMTDAELDECAGPQPEDKVTVAYTEWEQIKPKCDATEAEWTREGTKTTVASVLVNHAWIDGEPAVEKFSEKEIRKIEKEDIVLCPITEIVDNITGGSLAITGADPTEPLKWATGLLLAGAGMAFVPWGKLRRRFATN